jgi:hypothetical protein
VWQPPVECSRLEREVIKRIKRAKLFVWLREHRHELFDADFQAELAQIGDVNFRWPHRDGLIWPHLRGISGVV